eukprot:maker-scaffold1923_size24897-snap-gene-0.7 protein:Tk01740 transcript:maker-scaffold1923_size24897-snap-gene-0.7-mRNA-1 annotation:"abnormal spindle-like microcephaly-associated protein homolog"
MYLTLQRSVHIIQRSWRRYSLVQRLEELILERKINQCATQIQSFWKMHRSRQELLRRLKLALELKRNQSATLIQSHWKAHIQREQFCALKTASVVLQSHFRQTKARRRFLTMKRAAGVIHKWWKGCLFQKHLNERIHLSLMNRSATKIQGYWKMWRGRQAFLRIMADAQEELRQYSATLIQSQWRSHSERKAFLHLRHSTLRIQSEFRKWSAQKRFASMKWAATIIQRSWRHYRFVQHLHERIQFRLLNQSATKIQSYWRMWMSRRSYLRFQTEAQEELEHCSATLIQAQWRVWIQLKAYKQMRCSAIVLQAQVKGWIQRRQFESQKRSARVLQRSWRRFKFVQSLAHHLKWKRMHQSATRIQTQWRMWQARQSYLRTQNACLAIQKYYRSHVARLAFQAERKLESLAATTIQSAWRRNQVRRERQRIIQTRNEAALVIQSAWRQYQNRLCLERRIQACVRIQRGFRKFIQRCCLQRCLSERIALRHEAQERAWTESRSLAAILIQSHWRGWTQRQRYIGLRKSSIMVQKQVRGWIVRRDYERSRSSVRVIQRAWRRFALIKRLEEQSEMRLRHQWATKIQSLWRMRMARREFAQIQASALEELKNYSAILIQSHWRGCVQRGKFLRLRRTCIRLQALAKACIAQRRLVSMRESARIIQRAWRRHRLIRHLAELQKYKVMTQSAITIQSLWRMHKARRHYRHLTHLAASAEMAGATIQRSMQMWVVRKKFIRIRRAVTVIQKHYRGYQVRTAFKSDCKIKQTALLPDFPINEELSKKIEEVRQKVFIANENATEDKKLGNRTALALDRLYRSRDIAHLLMILKDLDVTTRFSANCCDQIMSENDRCVRILLNLLRRCNRSIPHMDIISTILDVFINLAKYEPSRMVLLEAADDVLETLIEVLVIYRDKSVDIYTKTFALLWLLASSNRVKKILTLPLNAKKLLESHKHYHRLHNKQMERGRRRNNYLPNSFRPSPAQAKPKMPKLSLCPPWQIREDVIRHHKDPFLASEMVLNKLALKPLPLA